MKLKNLNITSKNIYLSTYEGVPIERFKFELKFYL